MFCTKIVPFIGNTALGNNVKRQVAFILSCTVVSELNYTFDKYTVTFKVL